MTSRAGMAGLTALLALWGCGGSTGAPDESRALVEQGLMNAPDFVVTALSVPTSVLPGSTFNATVEVCNRGDVGAGTEVGLFLSDDALIDALSDHWSGSLYVGWLAPGECQRHPVEVMAWAPWNGAWYVGAVADPYEFLWEGDESNNALAQGPMGIGYGPDFIVESVTAPSAITPGQWLTAQVRVCNQGTEPGSTDVALFLSADDAIHPELGEDVAAGSAYVDWLYPGQCSSIRVEGQAYPPSPGDSGPYYLGAVVDPAGNQPELIEDNNVNADTRLGVGYGPDFVVESVTGPTSVEPGQWLAAQVRVCNRGTEPGSTDVELYLSTDTALNPGTGEDAPVGSTFVYWLNPGQCTTVSINGNAYPPPPGTDGPYYLGAIVDPNGNQSELIEDNNANAGYRLGVGYGPDFVIKSVTGPASVEFGQPFSAQVRVCNVGTQWGDTEVALYLSADDVIQGSNPNLPPEDVSVGTTYSGWLSPGQCNTVSINGNAYPPSPGYDGAYYLGAIADPSNNYPELMEDNNTHVGYRMGVGYGPDFVIESVTGPASVEFGQSFSAQVRVCNVGTQSGDTNVELYLSVDDVIRSYNWPLPLEDAPVGMVNSGWLSPGQCSTVSIDGNAYPPSPGYDGAYYLGAIVDPYRNQFELNEDNNTHSGYRMGVGYGPDFIVESVTGPASVEFGQPFSTQVRVCNVGTRPGDTDVELYLSADDVIQGYSPNLPPEDASVGMTYSGWLSPGQCSTVSIDGNAYPPSPGYDGAYYLGAIVDPYRNQFELNEDNNTHVGYRMGVGSGPDFVIESVTGPTSVESGQMLTAQVRVCNVGTRPGDTDVELYLSVDDVIRSYNWPLPPEDAPVGWANSGWLLSGQCSTVSVNGNAYPPPPGTDGAYYLGAIADPSGNWFELNEDNNTHSGYRLGVGSAPDFIVESVTGPASVESGQPFSAQVRVCNVGTRPGDTDVGLYLSADDVIRSYNWPLPPEDELVSMANSGWLSPGQCNTVNFNGNAYPPSPGYDGAYYLGAIADPSGYWFELNEDNNTHSGYRMGVGSGPDFVIESVRGPYSAIPGNAFTAQVRVCNQGTRPGDTNVELYLSVDDVIRGPLPNLPWEDAPVGMAPTGPLYPGQCTDVSIDGNAYSPPPGTDGAYYLGAVVDPSGSLFELNEDNNTHSGYRMGVGYGPDLVINTVTGPASVQPGSTFTAAVSVCNRGQTSASGDVELYLSADATIQPPRPYMPAEDYFLGGLSTGSLAPGACTNHTLSVTAPSVPEGAYYLGGVVDPYDTVPELIEDNNAKALNRIGVGLRPDFVITSVTGPSSVLPGNVFTATVAICNRGQSAGTADVEVYLSADTNIQTAGPMAPPEDHFLGTLPGVSLSAGQCVTRALSVSAPWVTEGVYYLGGVVDPQGAVSELIEDNNTKAGGLIGVGEQPDFVITSVTGPTSLRAGAPITVSVRVCNDGQSVAQTSVDVFLSADRTIEVPGPMTPSGDIYLGSIGGVLLSAGQCVTRSLSVTADAPPGSYYLGAVVDPYGDVSEFLEDNNARAGTYLTLTP